MVCVCDCFRRVAVFSFRFKTLCLLVFGLATCPMHRFAVWADKGNQTFADLKAVMEKGKHGTKTSDI